MPLRLNVGTPVGQCYIGGDTVGRDAVHDHVMKGVGLGECRHVRSSLVHGLDPPDQFVVVVVDALVAVLEMAQGSLAARVAPEVESLDEVMHQFVAHHDQFLNLGSDLGEPLRSHGHAVADGHGDSVGTLSSGSNSRSNPSGTA